MTGVACAGLDTQQRDSLMARLRSLNQQPDIMTSVSTFADTGADTGDDAIRCESSAGLH